jgi:hypothetical protein
VVLVGYEGEHLGADAGRPVADRIAAAHEQRGQGGNRGVDVAGIHPGGPATANGHARRRLVSGLGEPAGYDRLGGGPGRGLTHLGYAARADPE